MCRTVHAMLAMVVCGIQMVVRTLMTVLLMIENIVRMVLQTIYNFMSFMLQLLSLLPICIVFLVTTKLKCFMCGGGGPCPVARGGTCDMVMSFIAFALLVIIFRSTGLLDKILFNLGYAKAPEMYTSFEPTPGEYTTCSRDTITTTPVPTTTSDLRTHNLWAPLEEEEVPEALKGVEILDDDFYYKDAEEKVKAMLAAKAALSLPKCKTTTKDPYGGRRAKVQATDVVTNEPTDEQERDYKELLKELDEPPDDIKNDMSVSRRKDEEGPPSIESPSPLHHIGHYKFTTTKVDIVTEKSTQDRKVERVRPSKRLPVLPKFKSHKTHRQPITTSLSKKQEINTSASPKDDFDYTLNQQNPTNHTLNVVYYLM